MKVMTVVHIIHASSAADPLATWNLDASITVRRPPHGQVFILVLLASAMIPLVSLTASLQIFPTTPPSNESRLFPNNLPDTPDWPVSNWSRCFGLCGPPPSLLRLCLAASKALASEARAKERPGGRSLSQGPPPTSSCPPALYSVCRRAL